ncbi:MAG: hypothetical protein EBZ49_09290 [Proteobacteria bacterium]|nr:hypothetical protein [Pseudomonadota bacterium]
MLSALCLRTPEHARAQVAESGPAAHVKTVAVEQIRLAIHLLKELLPNRVVKNKAPVAVKAAEVKVEPASRIPPRLEWVKTDN